MPAAFQHMAGALPPLSIYADSRMDHRPHIEENVQMVVPGVLAASRLVVLPSRDTIAATNSLESDGQFTRRARVESF